MRPFLVLKRWVQGAADEKWYEVDGRLRPDEIADYYTGIHNGTIVVLKCNSSFLLTHNIEEFDALMRDYYFVLATAQNGSLQLSAVLSPDDLRQIINIINHAHASN